MNVKPLTNGAPPAPAPKPRAKVLQGLTKTRLSVPASICVYGTEGIGKSTFAANAPNPIFLGSEDGTAELEVVRYPHIETWSDILGAVDVLEQDEHAFETVVLDTLDWAEPLCWAHVCEAAGKRSIEAFDYGKGYVAAVDEWRRLLKRLDGLRARRRMHVILIAHAIVRTFRNPEGDDFDRYSLKLHEKSAGVVKEWCDSLLFANYETFTVKGDNATKRAKGIASGARVLHTERRAAWDAKNRYGLPETLPLGWSDFWDAVQARRGDPTAADTRARIDAMLAELEALGATELVEKIRAALPAAGDRLAEYANRIAVRLNETKEKTR